MKESMKSFQLEQLLSTKSSVNIKIGNLTVVNLRNILLYVQYVQINDSYRQLSILMF